jgi:hypothetical protein
MKESSYTYECAESAFGLQAQMAQIQGFVFFYTITECLLSLVYVRFNAIAL